MNKNSVTYKEAIIAQLNNVLPTETNGWAANVIISFVKIIPCIMMLFIILNIRYCNILIDSGYLTGECGTCNVIDICKSTCLLCNKDQCTSCNLIGWLGHSGILNDIYVIGCNVCFWNDNDPLMDSDESNYNEM